MGFFVSVSLDSNLEPFWSPIFEICRLSFTKNGEFCRKPFFHVIIERTIVDNFSNNNNQYCRFLKFAALPSAHLSPAPLEKRFIFPPQKHRVRLSHFFSLPPSSLLRFFSLSTLYRYFRRKRATTSSSIRSARARARGSLKDPSRLAWPRVQKNRNSNARGSLTLEENDSRSRAGFEDVFSVTPRLWRRAFCWTIKPRE